MFHFVSGIHQSDHVGRCPAGINRLPLYLSKSNTLYCLFDIEWVNRLWCVWELATYLRLRENPKVTFICISQRSCEIIVVFVYFLQNALTTALSTTITIDIFSALHVAGRISDGNDPYHHTVRYVQTVISETKSDTFANVFTLSI